jgi:hypothetical protein
MVILKMGREMGRGLWSMIIIGFIKVLIRLFRLMAE